MRWDGMTEIHTYMKFFDVILSHKNGTQKSHPSKPILVYRIRVVTLEKTNNSIYRILPVYSHSYYKFQIEIGVVTDQN